MYHELISVIDSFEFKIVHKDLTLNLVETKAYATNIMHMLYIVFNDIEIL
jgi:hypothetical protein